MCDGLRPAAGEEEDRQRVARLGRLGLPVRRRFRAGFGDGGLNAGAGSAAGFHRGLYEVHLPVTDLARSVDFYVEKLGFAPGFGDASEGGVLLLYRDGSTRWMLGLFEVESVVHRHPAEYHVAFRVAGGDADRMIGWLEERGIEPTHPGTAPIRGPMEEPIVHGWMPAAAVFFRDPDGHLLELIAELDGPPRPDLAYRPLSEWKRLVGEDR